MDIKTFEHNTAGKDYACGDIHGCFSRLERTLADVRFDAGCDRLFSVGDLVDRGPESDRVLEFLDKPWFHAVRGNHDQMAIDYTAGELDPASYVTDGGSWFVRKTHQQRMPYRNAMAQLPVGIELDDGDGGRICIVHADCPAPSWNAFKVELDGPRAREVRSRAMWSRDRIRSDRSDGVPDAMALLVGHTPVQRTTSLGNVFFIDTGAGHFSGLLTLVELMPQSGVILREVAHA
ncbi:metallophosphoesterase [Paraburkholderia sediminicola]|uniref:metallophosphoesterase n=1 Tax=Paraburkholderia sediminicola TaxID=458836 RepID=UPI0038BDA84B